MEKREGRGGGGGGGVSMKHEGSWYMRISDTPLASKVKQALLVVDCIKLHLTALNCVLNLRQILPCENKDRQTLGQRFSFYIKWKLSINKARNRG